MADNISCSRCVMDNNSPNTNLTLDAEGVCNNCRSFEIWAKPVLEENEDLKRKKLDALVSEIKQHGAQEEYDCLLGVSGGVDSSYLAYLAKQLGLRPLVIHFDNGWNSELAVDNI